VNDVWQQSIGVFPVNFTEQGDEWCHHLTVALTGDDHMSARGTNGADPVELGPPPAGPVHSKLLVRPHADGISCTVTGDGESVPAGQVEPWRRAADTAVSLLGREDRAFAWEAIIGTAPQTFGLDRCGPLEEPQDFGPVHLAPGGVCMREQVYTERLGGTGIRHSFPLMASGAYTTYVWDRTAQIAQLCLRRTCALLTLITGEVWIPRSHPAQVLGGLGGLRVPPVFGHVPSLPGEADSAGWRGEIPLGTKPFRLRDWAVQAWPLLAADRDLAGALNAVYEGMRLEQRHPSLAHLTFVAAIEGFGARFVPDAPCDCNPGCTHTKPVAQKRFRKALKTVMTNREVEQIWEMAYTLRSFTGHTGALLGSERTYGYSHYGSLFDTADDAVFDLVILGQLRNASRRVVAKALGRPG
jgi:hypothetical protein